MIPQEQLQTMYAYHREKIENDFFENYGRIPKILNLTLKKKWFDMILSGEKREEYREIKEYWIKRIWNKQPDIIHFRNGYGDNMPSMFVRCMDMYFGEGVEDWGAVNGADYLVLKLGPILKSYNHA